MILLHELMLALHHLLVQFEGRIQTRRYLWEVSAPSEVLLELFGQLLRRPVHGGGQLIEDLLLRTCQGLLLGGLKSQLAPLIDFVVRAP